MFLQWFKREHCFLKHLTTWSILGTGENLAHFTEKLRPVLISLATSVELLLKTGLTSEEAAPESERGGASLTVCV